MQPQRVSSEGFGVNFTGMIFNPTTLFAWKSQILGVNKIRMLRGLLFSLYSNGCQPKALHALAIFLPEK